MRPQGAPGGSSGDNYATAYLLSCIWTRHFGGKPGVPSLAMVEVLGITMITMRRLTYLVVAAIGISAVNLALLLWVIVPISLEWEGFYSERNPATLEGGFRWFPVSVNSRNETTAPSRYRPSTSIGGSGDGASDAIDRLHRDNSRLKEEMRCLERKARDPYWPC